MCRYFKNKYLTLLEGFMMNDERFTTDGYHINDTYNKETWLLDKTNAQEIVDVMNGLDNYSRQNRKALSKLQKRINELEKRLESDEFEKTLEAKDMLIEYIKTLETFNNKV